MSGRPSPHTQVLNISLVRLLSPTNWVSSCPWARRPTLTAPDWLAVALHGWLRFWCLNVCMNGGSIVWGSIVKHFEWPLVSKRCMNADHLPFTIDVQYHCKLVCVCVFKRIASRGVIKSSSTKWGKTAQSGNSAWTSSKRSPIRREKTPNLATLLNVLTLQRQRKSMRPTENEAGMKLKLWFWMMMVNGWNDWVTNVLVIFVSEWADGFYGTNCRIWRFETKTVILMKV